MGDLTFSRRRLLSAPFSPATPLRLLLVSALVVLAGCDAVGEPERFYNDDARPPVVGALNLAQLQDGQHVAGRITLALDLDSLAGRLDRVVLYVDGEEVGALERGPFRFDVDTPRYADGEHAVSVAAYVRQPRGGLLNLAGAPAVALTARLVFDQRPPTPASGLSVALEGRRPRLRWDENRDPNFYAYVVYRRPDPSEGTPWWEGEVIATLTDRSQTTFLDGELAEVIGAGAAYRVAVSNRAAVSDAGERAVATLGTLVPSLRAYHSGSAAVSPDGSEAYAVTGDRLVAVSAATGAEVRSLALPELAGSYNAASDLHVDSGLLYVMTGTTGERTLRVLRPHSFNVVASYPLPWGATQIAVRGSRLYAYGGTQGRDLYVLDAGTGAVVSRGPVALDWPFSQVVGASPDGRSVYLMDQVDNRHVLARVDVSGQAPRTAERLALGYGSWALAVAPDGRLLVHTGSDVQVLTASLAPSGAISVGSGGIPAAAHVAQGRLYLAYNGTGAEGVFGGMVAEYDLGSLDRLRTWQFAGGPTGLAVGSGSMVVLGQGGGWIVSL